MPLITSYLTDRKPGWSSIQKWTVSNIDLSTSSTARLHGCTTAQLHNNNNNTPSPRCGADRRDNDNRTFIDSSKGQRSSRPDRRSMEKFSQFRDRGSGISPFLPVTADTSLPAKLFHFVVFLVRVPLLAIYAVLYFIFLHHLRFLPLLLHKLFLWTLLAIPGIWWADLQLDGVARGSLHRQPRTRMPHAGTVVAANHTSPIDAIYLAAVFDPVFVLCHPGSRKVRRVGLLAAALAALSTSPQLLTRDEWERRHAGELTTLRALLAAHPGRIVACFPEAGTTNGKGILPLSPCLLTATPQTPVFPVSLRYAPADVTTPVPGWKAGLAFFWRLLGRPTHTVRVRIAEAVFNTSGAVNGVASEHEASRVLGTESERGDDAPTPEEQAFLDKVADALARLGRVKRVGLTLREKKAFVAAWNKRR
ncbi:hypothetical protein VTJ83DRAFT_3347 [Remersonia thermophila]|uniref:Phospholipid/glycerol acyltransferase domain-containing protein n=1 Tax=Remersonia thermophila TaxID=72144 RepID=A0ABR4DDR9_9PEZI